MMRDPFGSAPPSSSHRIDPDVHDLCAALEARTGIIVSEAKRHVVAVRVAARAHALGLTSIAAYRALIERREAELRHAIELITTHETGFFRHAHHFVFLEHELVPRWRDAAARGSRPHRARVWSAGCSTGEEPYSIAMVLRRGLPASAGFTAEVLATDISEAALGVARGATYARDRASQIPNDYRRAFTHDASVGDEAVTRVHDAITPLVRFERVNLVDEIYPVARDYDVVFCRNVLIYFRPEVRRAVIERLIDHLAPGGHLVLGQAEGLLVASRLRRVAATVYQVATPGASR